MQNAGAPSGLSRTSGGLEQIAKDLFLNIKGNIF